MKAQLKNGGVKILLEGGETAREMLAAVAMATFAMFDGGANCTELPVSEALVLPKVIDGPGAERWCLRTRTLYAKVQSTTGQQIDDQEVSVTFPHPLSGPLYADFITRLERALGKIAAAQQ